MKFLIRVCLLVVVSLYPSAVLAKAEETKSDHDQIAKLYDAYHSGWLTNDATVPKTIMDLFTEDAILLPDDGLAIVSGKDSISEWWFPDGTITGTVEIFSHSDTVIELNGSMASAHGRFALSFTVNGVSTTTEGNQLILARKTEGVWKISAVMWNSKPTTE